MGSLSARKMKHSDCPIPLDTIIRKQSDKTINVETLQKVEFHFRLLTKLLPCIGAAFDEQAGDPVSPRGPSKERLEALLLPVAILPVGPIQQVQRKFTIGGIVRLQIVARFRGQKG